MVWVGYDQPRKLGSRETGGGLALPIWIDFMRTALKGRPESVLPTPSTLVPVAVDSRSGRPVATETPGAITEYMPAERLQQVQQDAERAPPEKTVSEDELF